jgi:predicted adenine nucleotide alpha hydrolase (AANH) superfamily ATPase
MGVCEAGIVKIVLHICCGVCAAGVVDTVINEGHQVFGFFSNSNIHPEDEYRRRLETARSVTERMKITLNEDVYDPEEWYAGTKSLAQEPEGGERCTLCFGLRLKRTHQHMLDLGADAYTTTLTVSPRKRADVVNRIGLEISGDRFLARDFKKREGFKRAIERAKAWEIYRQDYCGCSYSRQ